MSPAFRRKPSHSHSLDSVSPAKGRFALPFKGSYQRTGKTALIPGPSAERRIFGLPRPLRLGPGFFSHLRITSHPDFDLSVIPKDGKESIPRISLAAACPFPLSLSFGGQVWKRFSFLIPSSGENEPRSYVAIASRTVCRLRRCYRQPSLSWFTKEGRIPSGD